MQDDYVHEDIDEVTHWISSTVFAALWVGEIYYRSVVNL